MVVLAWIPTTTNNMEGVNNMGESSLSLCTSPFELAPLDKGFSSGRISLYRYNDMHQFWLESIHIPGHDRGVLDVVCHCGQLEARLKVQYYPCLCDH